MRTTSFFKADLSRLTIKRDKGRVTRVSNPVYTRVGMSSLVPEETASNSSQTSNSGKFSFNSSILCSLNPESGCHETSTL